MPKDGLFTIGEFSALTGVGIHSLRYYDEIGALKPEYVDPVSSYRYYGYKQLSRIPAINLCRDAGINLNEFSSFMKGDLIDYTKLLDESRRSLEHKICDYRIKQLGLDQLECLVRISDELRADGQTEAELSSMVIWTIPYDDVMLQDDAGLLIKLSVSARKRRLRISPSFYGLLQLNENGYVSQYAFSLLLVTDDIPAGITGIMNIPAGRYTMRVNEALFLSTPAATQAAPPGQVDHRMVLSAALICGDTLEPLYFSASQAEE